MLLTYSSKSKLVTGFNQLKNFDVMVASDVIDPTQSSDKQLCAYVEEQVPQADWMEIYCNPPISGR